MQGRGVSRGHVLAVLVLATAGLVFFQNCSQVNFQLDPDNPINAFYFPGSKTVTAGDVKSYPPLKLFFVVDNSGTMKANQIALSDAFDKLFTGDNASTLEPFDSTAYVITTAQESLLESDEVFSRLPDRAVWSLADLPIADILKMRSGSTSEGKIAGDIAGYGLEVTTQSGLKKISYLPAPVAGFREQSGVTLAELGVRKPSGAAVGPFAKEFADRLEIIAPERSAILTQNGQPTGILDRIVDRESGLCALARMLKHSNRFVKPGDVAAFILVSDEDDVDAAGVKCIDSIEQVRGDEDLIDGSCMRPRTSLTYRPKNPSPDVAKCRVDFQNRFNWSYSYSVPNTLVQYKESRYSYKRYRTTVNYKYNTYKHAYDKLGTSIDYFVSNPTYQVKNTDVVFHLRTCPIRDGVEDKTNCSYTRQTAKFEGDYQRTSCDAFVAGKLPAKTEATDPAYKPVCSAGSPDKKNGKCPSAASNPDVFDCQLNATAATATKSGHKVATESCEQFAGSVLASNAILGSSAYPVACKDSDQRIVNQNGRCSADKANCVETATPSTSQSVTLDGLYMDPSACNARAQAQNADAILSGSDAPVCVRATDRLIANQGGFCSSLSNAHAIPGSCVDGESAEISRNFVGAPQSDSSADCLAFATPKISNEIVSTVRCSALAATISDKTGSESWSGYPDAQLAVGSACPANLKGQVEAANPSISTWTSCTVSGFQSSNSTANGACMSDSAAKYCAANGVRNCTQTEIAGGDLYLPPTTVSRDGEFTCATACAQAPGVCAAGSSGTVGENFHQCSTTALADQKIKSFTAERANRADVCEVGSKKVISKGPYRSLEPISRYVAGKKSADQEPHALADYIRERSSEVFAGRPSVSVFVREPGDQLGQNGSIGQSYLDFAARMNGQSKSVLSDASGYATALQSLGSKVRKQVIRSMSVVIGPQQKIVRVWHRRAAGNFSVPLDEAQWSSVGGTVTLADSVDFEAGDEFQFDYE